MPRRTESQKRRANRQRRARSRKTTVTALPKRLR